MIYFILAILLLAVGYPLLSRIAARTFGEDDSIVTPSIRLKDGVDFVELPKWRIFLIQFINIAGLGPIYGAISGALFGPVAFLWIVLGGLLVGGAHDYFSAMISLRHNGSSFTEIAGRYLGKSSLWLIRFFTIMLLIFLTTVFVKGPSTILSTRFSEVPILSQSAFWLMIIFGYVLAAAIFPIHKVMGRVTPIFGVAFILMPVALLFILLFKGEAQNLPPFSLQNFHYNPKTTIWPMLFVTIACGAVSGFHATQSPLMARCINKERDGRTIFYGAMIAESLVALIWAAAAMTFMGSIEGLRDIMQANQGDPAVIVLLIGENWLGSMGVLLAIISVVVAPITSADSALRATRLSVADSLTFSQTSVRNRLILTIPLSAIVIILTNVDFAIIWRYFAFSNQLLATLTLWTITAYFKQVKGKILWWTLLGALFMTNVVISYILYAPEGFRLPWNISVSAGIIGSFVVLILFLRKKSSATA
ncbi:carbon starvation protein A [Entomospira culicis]|uniref:Carbon starvation protein A n=1 Tax=Entomospira culicis TaxID=2719989 RepID=A0A968GGP1_9SPIO|nr:carbon starvation protein A [Entomospira culicis]NIZ19599.1 carbon starvation protein A [Entomospira culicis]NIZ69496.1 carbon starvation protein A [Entomospira culicis]WDI36611.1 carbon starvation protein A [Entomospira culicis]WDI38239.1 carbon starvation protein A [Entomospira culicis]